MKKKLIVIAILGLFTTGFFFFQSFRGTPIKETSYSHFVESVRNKSADSVVFSERFIDYTIGERRYKTARPSGEVDSLKEVKENKIYYTFNSESKPILTPVVILLFGIFLAVSTFIMWRLYCFFNRVISNMKHMQNGPHFGSGSGLGGSSGPGDPFGGNKPSSPAESTSKFFEPEKSDVRFDDIAGNEEAKEELEQIVDFLKSNKKYKKMGANLPKGAILYGPSGTGKTMFAKAIAGESGVPFMYVSGSEFVEMYVGVGAARVRDMFAKAREASPCVVFIDEIDAVGKKRSNSDKNSERDQTLNQILVEMDGFNSLGSDVIVIGATNRLETLDDALLRPGRFDKHVSVDLPDREGRFKILDLCLKKLPLLEDDINIERLSKKTVGFSGADLTNVVNESALLAVKDELKKIDQDCLERAIEKVAYGSEKKSRKQDAKELENTAWHESGHALLGLILDNNAKIDKITIIPRTKSLGHVSFLSEEKHSTKSQLLNSICIALGGRVGEEMLAGDYTPGASSDIRSATRTARNMVTRWGMSSLGMLHLNNMDEGWKTHELSDDMLHNIDKEIRGIVDGEYDRAKKLLDMNKESLKNLSEMLLDKETLTGEEVEKLLDGVLVDIEGYNVFFKKDEE